MRQCYCADFSPRELAGFYAELSPRLCLFGQSRGEVFFFRVSSDGELLEQERYRKKLSRAKEAVARNNKRNGACVCFIYLRGNYRYCILEIGLLRKHFKDSNKDAVNQRNIKKYNFYFVCLFL
jgi:hypothetical protein